MAGEKNSTDTLVAEQLMSKSLFSRNITRRDFLNGTSIGMGGMLLGLGAPNSRSSAVGYAQRPSQDPDWYGYGGVGDYRTSHGIRPTLSLMRTDCGTKSTRALINWNR